MMWRKRSAYTAKANTRWVGVKSKKERAMSFMGDNSELRPCGGKVGFIE